MWLDGYTVGEICQATGVSEPTALKYRPVDEESDNTANGDLHDEIQELKEMLRHNATGRAVDEVAIKDVKEIQENITHLKRRVNELRLCLLNSNQANDQATYCPHCQHWGVLMLRQGKLTCPNCGRHVMPPLK